MTGEGIPAGLGGNHSHAPHSSHGGHAHLASWARASEEYRTRTGRGHDRTTSGASSVLFEDDELDSEPAEQVRMQNLDKDKSKGKARDVFAIVEGDEVADEDERPSNDEPNGYSPGAHLLSHNP